MEKIMSGKYPANTFVRVGRHSVTYDQMWEIWDGQPSWVPGVEWEWEDYEMDESSPHVMLVYSNPVDRFWEIFLMPGDEMKLASRMDRIAYRSDDEFLWTFHVS